MGRARKSVLPSDHLKPIWRCTPNHSSGIFTIALDPREAAFVLERGWATLDDIRYKVTLEGCDGKVQGDGRIMVRCNVADAEGAKFLLSQGEAFRRLNYDKSL